MGDSESRRMQLKLVEHWDGLMLDFFRLRSTAQIRPIDGWSVFQPLGQSEGSIRFRLQPVVFNLPERASHLEMNLFVVVQGRLSLGVDAFNGGVVTTHDFCTEVAYFRKTLSNLVHIYGAHYDFSENELGHPAFHGQVRDFSKLGGAINVQYGICLPEMNRVEGLLKTVRVPTAQMDFFSLFLQLCADHLLYARSGPEEKGAFNELIRRSHFCRGAVGRIPQLDNAEAGKCLRSWHWYPRIS